jgi:hypothetical protein
MTKNQSPSTPQEGKSRYILLDEETVNRLIDARLTGAQYRAFFYFSLVDPFGNRYVSSAGQLARERLAVSKSTYYECLAALQECALFEFEEVSLRLRNRVGSKSPEKLSAGKIVRETEPVSEKLDRRMIFRTPVQEIGSEFDFSEKQSPKAYEIKDSESPQYLSVALNSTISIDSKKERTASAEKLNPPSRPAEATLTTGSVNPESFNGWTSTPLPDWDTFSAADDPAFFEFVLRHKVPKLPQPPASPQCVTEGWIRKDGDLLYDEYQAWLAGQQRLEQARYAVASPPEPPAGELLSDLTPAQHLLRCQGLWKITTLQANVQRSIAEHPEWGLAIGPDGPCFAPTVPDLQEIQAKCA